MKKYILVLLMLVSPLMAQETKEEEKTANTSQKISRYTMWLMKIRGYSTWEEFQYNNFMILSLGTSVSSIFDNNNSNIPKIDLKFSMMSHYKNKFYALTSVSYSFSWGINPLFMGISLGLGGSFFDSRNEIGQGWLIGMDWENGYQFGAFGDAIDAQSHFFTGINFRGLYRSSTRVGFSVAFQIVYEYYFGIKEGVRAELHGLSIGPKIGIIF